MTRYSQIVIAVATALGTTAGNIVLIGTEGLSGVALTDRVTQGQIDDITKNLPQGMANGDTAVELTGIHTAVNLTVAGTALIGAKVYRNASGTYDLVNTGTMQGYALAASASAGAIIPVGLARA